MPSDAPLPYPLAGVDSGQSGQPGPEPDRRRPGRSWSDRPIAPMTAAALILALAGVIWMALQWRADQQRIRDLAQQLDQSRTEAERARQALGSPFPDLPEPRQSASAEMVVASVAVGRFLQIDPETDDAEPQGFVQAFFGIGVRTTAWLALPGRTSAGGVLARVDRPEDPRLIWVSRRSPSTADPSVPSRANCLQLDVAALLRAAEANRTFSEGADTAPLRKWADTYRFVPPEMCGTR